MRACGGALRLLALAAMLAPGSSIASARMQGTLSVRARPVTESFRAYGQVEPIAVTQVSAVEAGIVQRLVLPGQPVHAGEVLAVLGGPQAQALLARRRGALRAASIQLAADRRKLAAQLVTRQTVAAEEASFEAARGRLQVALQTLTLRSPANGQVLAVEAADGEQIGAGQPILTLQTGRPWLQATYYGASALAIHPGMRGEFQPASGSEIPVRVRTVAQTLAPDGGTQVGLLPVMSQDRGDGRALRARAWRSGMWGTLTLTGTTRSMIEVPTRALILERAQWWVLVRTAQGEQRRRVVPGPTRGWMTAIASGLRPGERVVVQNAYLEFYRGISRHYTPPD